MIQKRQDLGERRERRGKIRPRNRLFLYSLATLEMCTILSRKHDLSDLLYVKNYYESALKNIHSSSHGTA